MGTAGHIDHGKTTLIQTLTGINPDRLQEEKSRGMTVDLGFAWFSLAKGNIGVVDVPGHHKLIKNMLAGVGQVDFVLLIIAADDGWMPQTQEHVDILELYGVKHGAVALTKADLVDEEWLELVKHDIEEHIAETTLASFPVIPVSATTGYNIDTLKESLNDIISNLPPREESGNPLLWIDRVFTIKGSGTVVTGTLLDGALEVGMDITINPLRAKAKIRGLQTQTHTIEKGQPHSRLAVNLTGIEKEQIRRGMYLALPNRRPCFSLINSHVRLLPQAPQGLKTGQQVKLYIGTLETLATVKILDSEKIDPGQNGFVQIELEQPAHFSFQDNFIIRHSELQATLGGGRFIEEGIVVRGKNLRLIGPHRLNSLFAFEKPEAFLDLALLRKKNEANPKTLGLLKAADRNFWTKEQFIEHGLTLHPELVQFGNYIMAPERLNTLQQFITQRVEEFHQKNPLAQGINKETLRAEIKIPSRLFDQVLGSTPQTEEFQGAIRSSKHRINLSSEEERQLARLIKQIELTPYEPLNLTAMLEGGFNKELIFAATYLNRLIALANEHWTSPKILNSVIDTLFSEDIFQTEFDLATFRDRFNTSRKFALSFLEYFDAREITIRKGDVRALGKRP